MCPGLSGGYHPNCLPDRAKDAVRGCVDHSPSFPAFPGACLKSLLMSSLRAITSSVSAQSDMPRHVADLIIPNVTGHCYGSRQCQTWSASSCEQLGPEQSHEHRWGIRDEDVRCLWRFEKCDVRAMQGNARVAYQKAVRSSRRILNKVKYT